MKPGILFLSIIIALIVFAAVVYGLVELVTHIADQMKQDSNRPPPEIPDTNLKNDKVLGIFIQGSTYEIT